MLAGPFGKEDTQQDRGQTPRIVQALREETTSSPYMYGRSLSKPWTGIVLHHAHSEVLMQ